MMTKGSLSIVGSRFSLVYKVIIYIILCVFIFGVIGFASLSSTLSPMKAEFDELQLGQTFMGYIKSLFRGVDNVGDNTLEQTQLYDQLVSKIIGVKDIVLNNIGTVYAGIAVLALLVFVFVVLYSAMYFPTTKILSEFMSSNSKFGFSSCYVASAKRNFNYSVVASLISFFYYTLTTAAAIAFTVLISKWNILFGFMTFFLAMGVVVSLKRSLLVAWLPAYLVDNQSIKNSMITTFKHAKKHFWFNFIVFYTYYLIFTAITISLAFVTFFTAVPFFLGFIMVYQQAFELVNYYHYKGYKYYKDEQTVVDPKKKYGNAVLENPVSQNDDGELNVSGIEKAKNLCVVNNGKENVCDEENPKAIVDNEIDAKTSNDDKTE